MTEDFKKRSVGFMLILFAGIGALMLARYVWAADSLAREIRTDPKAALARAQKLEHGCEISGKPDPACLAARQFLKQY